MQHTATHCNTHVCISMQLPTSTLSPYTHTPTRTHARILSSHTHANTQSLPIHAHTHIRPLTRTRVKSRILPLSLSHTHRCILCFLFSLFLFRCYGVASSSRLLKIIGLFCRTLLLCRALSQKRPIILRSLLIEATPYVFKPSLSFSLSLCCSFSYRSPTRVHPIWKGGTFWDGRIGLLLGVCCSVLQCVAVCCSVLQCVETAGLVFY